MEGQKSYSEGDLKLARELAQLPIHASPTGYIETLLLQENVMRQEGCEYLAIRITDSVRHAFNDVVAMHWKNEAAPVDGEDLIRRGFYYRRIGARTGN